MERSEAIRRLAADQRVVEDGQEVVADDFTPADAYGVTRLFYAVYGDAYPIDTFYLPERLIEENRCGNIRSAVTRTASGDIVSHMALYRSSAPSPHLFEYGLGLTLPSYRSTRATFLANQKVLALVGKGDIHGIYGEAVCNHIITQKLSRKCNALETAVEPALMPAEAYEAEQSADGRVGCLLYSRIDRDVRRRLHIPTVYEGVLASFMEGLSLDREHCLSESGMPSGALALDVKRFDFAGVARCSVTTPGDGLALRLADLERQMRGDGYALIQFFVDLGKPWSGGVVEQLWQSGYSLGGFLPGWFGDDGLLMQRHLVSPEFEGMKIFSERGQRLLEIVRRDWAEATARMPL